MNCLFSLFAFELVGELSIEMEDRHLLREYTKNGSEEAFAALVKRHLGLVYSAALRRVGNHQGAQDVTQSVFILLAA